MAENTMEITVYAKKRQTRDGKESFFSYLTTLKKKDGSPCTCAVKFAAPAKNPDPLECPMNIIVRKEDCNMVVEPYTNDRTGETKDSYRLWIKNFEMGSPYVDYSMDDFIFN